MLSANKIKRSVSIEGVGHEAEAKDLFCKMQKERINSFFRESVRKNELKAAKQLWDKFKSVINIDRLDNEGVSLLHQVSVEGNTDMVEFFIGAGANVDIRDPEGWTPIHASAAASKVGATNALLRSGADVMLYTKAGELPIDVAGTLDVAVLIVEAMVAKGQRKLVEDYIRPITKATESSKIQVTRHQPYRKDGNSDLSFMAQKRRAKNRAHLRKLFTISESPDERIPKYTEETRDITAQSKADVVERVRRYTYPAANKPPQSKRSILKRSSMTSSDSSTDEEFSEDENCSVFVDRGTADDSNNCFSTIRVPERKSVTFPGEILGQACIMENDHRDLRRLILCGHIQDVNKLYPNGISPLHLAAIEDKVDCVKVLLECQANIDNTDPHGWTPLHAAVAMGNIRCVKALTRGGANLCATTDKGETVFDLANTDLVLKYLKMMATQLLLQGNKKSAHKAIRRTSSY